MVNGKPLIWHTYGSYGLQSFGTSILFLHRNFILPTDFHSYIFQRGGALNHQPVNQYCMITIPKMRIRMITGAFPKSFSARTKVQLPNGLGKEQRVAVFCAPEEEKEVDRGRPDGEDLAGFGVEEREKLGKWRIMEDNGGKLGKIWSSDLYDSCIDVKRYFTRKNWETYYL